MKRGMILPLAVPSCDDRHRGNSPSNKLLVAGTFPLFHAGGAASSSLLVKDKLERAPLPERVVCSPSRTPFFTGTAGFCLRPGGAPGRKKPSPPSSSPSRYTKWASYLLSFRSMRWMPLRSGSRGAGESGKKHVIHPYFFFCFYQ
jgi:hypothetical protein